MSSTITLYDLARRGTNSCWSYNVWKARLVLNYKELSYGTKWVDHVSLQPTIKDLGVQPHTPGAGPPGPPFTVPVIQTQEDVVMDSAAIARYLEKQYPQKPLHFDKELEAEADKLLFLTAKPMFAIYQPLVAREILRESTVDFFNESREKRFGMPLDKLEQVAGGEKAWAAAQPGFDGIRRFLKEKKQDDGPFVLGSKVSYVDFVIAAMYACYEAASKEMFERFMAMDEVFVKHYEASKAWLVRKD